LGSYFPSYGGPARTGSTFVAVDVINAADEVRR